MSTLQHPQVDLPLTKKQREVFENKVSMASMMNLPCTFNSDEVFAISILFARLQELESACLSRDWEAVENMTPQPE